MSKIFIAVPSVDKKLFVPCVQSLMNAMQAMLLMDVKFQFKFEVGCPYVSMARNNLVRAFMQSECTDLVFIDADLGFPPTAFRDLIDSTELVVGGAYPKKQPVEEYAVRLKTDENQRVINENGVLAAEALATGFLKINRSVFEKMQEAYPELQYTDAVTQLPTYNFFGTFVKEGRWYGDDYGFCHLWEQLGGTMHLLPNIDFMHMGNRSHDGNFHDYLMSQNSYPPALARALQIPGFMTIQEMEWLYQQAGRMQSVAEIGSWKGRSTVALLEGCRGPVLAVDNWTGHDPSSNGILEREADRENVYEVFRRNTSEYDNLRTFRGNSADVASLGGCPAEFDMVFIDAEHTYEGCKADIAAWLPKAQRLICGHDYSPEWPGVMQAVKEIIGPVRTVGTIWYKEL
jgi:hypothetical protein